MSNMIPLSQYLLMRLKELGIEHIFGVPGDYNLIFLDEIVNFKGIEWIGNCNELNAAYAADGYARVKGAAAVVTTFGVGELSAINGIAGAFAERVPVVKIVGAPSLGTQSEKAIMHHTFGTGDFHTFSDMYRKVTAAQALLTKDNPAAAIDRVLQTCWIKKRPVYISLPSDLVNYKVPAPPAPLDLTYPRSDKDAVIEMVERTVQLMNNAKNPIILVDICAIRHPMKELILKLLEKTQIPFASMNMGKGLLDESHSQYIGTYNGKYSSPDVQERVEKSDCILSFGTIMSDFNTGGFTTQLDANASIEIHSNHVRVGQSLYPDLYFDAVLPALIEKAVSHTRTISVKKTVFPAEKTCAKTIMQQQFWRRMSIFFEPEDIIVAETGTSSFALMGTPIPPDTIFISQTLWGSIGYSVGALLGAALAGGKRRALLFVGDGSFQLTAQEISTMLRYKLNPIVFLINNDGYTIERVIHGPTMPYNDIQMWDYARLPQIFGANVWSIAVKTPTELEKALQEIPRHNDKLIFIEVVMDKMDCPDVLREIAKNAAKMNEGL